MCLQSTLCLRLRELCADSSLFCILYGIFCICNVIFCIVQYDQYAEYGPCTIFCHIMILFVYICNIMCNLKIHMHSMSNNMSNNMQNMRKCWEGLLQSYRFNLKLYFAYIWTPDFADGRPAAEIHSSFWDSDDSSCSELLLCQCLQSVLNQMIHLA